MFIKLLRNKNGFSIVEGLMAGVLVIGIGVLSMRQSSFIQESYRNLTGERKSIDLTGQMTHALLDTANCQATLVNGSTAAGSSISQIVKADGTSLFRMGELYLNSSVRIERMQVVDSPGGDSLNLKVDFEKMNTKQGMKTFSKFLPLMVRTDASGIITSCFSFSDSVRDTVADIISKKLCEDNQGDLDDDANVCYIRGFDDPSNIACGVGFSLTQISYFPDEQKFVGACQRTFVDNSCPEGWIKNMVPNGGDSANTLFECFPISANGSTVQPFNRSCSLQAQGNSFALSCAGPGRQCTGCPNPSSMCTGTGAFDSCNRACPLGTNDSLCLNEVTNPTPTWVNGTSSCDGQYLVTPRTCSVPGECTGSGDPIRNYDPVTCPLEGECGSWGQWDDGVCTEDLEGYRQFTRECIQPPGCSEICQPDAEGTGSKIETDTNCPECDVAWNGWVDGQCSGTNVGMREQSRTCNGTGTCANTCVADGNGDEGSREIADDTCNPDNRVGISIVPGTCPEKNNAAYSAWVSGDEIVGGLTSVFILESASAISEGMVVNSGGGSEDDKAFSGGSGDSTLSAGTYQVQAGSINDFVQVFNPRTGENENRKRPYRLDVGSGGSYSFTGCFVPPPSSDPGCTETPAQCDTVQVSCTNIIYNGIYGVTNGCSGSNGACRTTSTGGICAFLPIGSPCDYGTQCQSGCCGTTGREGPDGEDSQTLGYCEPYGDGSSCGRGSINRTSGESSCPGSWIPESNVCPDDEEGEPDL